MSTTKFASRELWADGSICSDKSDANNPFGYQLGRYPENFMSFVGNNQDEEDRNANPVYYNWADMDNYDVDGMYRSSDSACGVGTRNGDGLDWFSLSDAVEGSEDAQNVPSSSRSRSRRKIFENDDASRLDRMIHSSNEFDLPESSSVYTGGSSPSNNYGYLQGGDTPYLSVYCSPSDMTSLDQPMSAIQSENISLTSLSLNDFYASDGVQSMRSDDARDQMYKHQVLETSSNNNPIKNECNTDVNMSIATNLEGSGEQVNSESTKSEDISAGDTSFRQLQHVMNQLDSRTKLCIRDSLYRLAWSAEQRNYYESLQGGVVDDKDSMFAEGGYMNSEMETDTNPIDRSIAHLLFHRASNSSVMEGEDATIY